MQSPFDFWLHSTVILGIKKMESGKVHHQWCQAHLREATKYLHMSVLTEEGDKKAEATPMAMGEDGQEQEEHCPLTPVLQIVTAYIRHDDNNNNNATWSSKGADAHLTL